MLNNCVCKCKVKYSDRRLRKKWKTEFSATAQKVNVPAPFWTTVCVSVKWNTVTGVCAKTTVPPPNYNYRPSTLSTCATSSSCTRPSRSEIPANYIVLLHKAFQVGDPGQLHRPLPQGIPGRRSRPTTSFSCTRPSRSEIPANYIVLLHKAFQDGEPGQLHCPLPQKVLHQQIEKWYACTIFYCLIGVYVYV